MTVREYLQHKYSSFGVINHEAELEEVIVSGALDPDATLSSSNVRSVERAFVKNIPNLLLFPTSVSELGVSISRAGESAIRAYYKAKCKEYGIDDALDGNKPTVKFL